MKRLALTIALLMLLVTLAAQEPAEHHGIKTQVTEWVKSTGLSPQAQVFLIAMLPIFELRGAIPWGLGMSHDMHWFVIYLIAVVGNMVPVFLILPALRLIEKLFSHIPVTRRFLDWLFARTRSRSKVIERYEELGLILFVAIPLPVTGAWTGATAAYIFGLSYWKSILCTLGGVCIAGVVVTFLSSMLFELGLLGLAILVAVLLIWYIAHRIRRRNHGAVRKEA